MELARVQLIRDHAEVTFQLLSEPLPSFVGPGLLTERCALLADAVAFNGDPARAEVLLHEGEVQLERGQPNVELEGARGDVLRYRGDLPEAAVKFRSALALAEAADNDYLRMRMLLNLGVTELQLEHFDEGKRHSEAALTLAERLGNKTVHSMLTGNIGYAYQGLGNYPLAEETFRRAEEEAGEAKLDVDQILWSMQTGLARFSQGDRESAKAIYERSLQKARDLRKDDKIADAQTALGALYIDDPVTAAPHLAEAARIYTAAGKQEDLLQVQLLQATSEARHGSSAVAASELTTLDQQTLALPSFHWKAEQELASLAVRDGNDQKAHTWFRRSIRTFQEQQCSVIDVTSKLPFQENGADLYRLFVSHLISEGRNDEALALYDEGRGTTLRDCEKSGSAVAHIQAPPPNARSLAQKLHGTLLVYYLLPNASYMWAISPQHTGFFRLPGEEEISRLITRHRGQVEGGKDPLADGDDAGRALYDVLIGSAQAQIHPGGRVYVLADRALSQLNFETLLTPGPQPHFWIDDVTVTNAASLRLLNELQSAPPRKQPGSFFLIGNPIYPLDQALPHAGEEVSKVEAHFEPARRVVLTEAAATSAGYLHANPERYSWIHIVAHAEADALRPLDSSILLAGGTDKLYANEIVKHPLHADLVTISGCFSSGTRAVSGEGLVGLAWAFERAGARHVIGSLWEVSDDSTPELMNRMYEKLVGGMPPERALREAKLLALHSPGRYSRPYYWAPFQMYSNGGDSRVH